MLMVGMKPSIFECISVATIYSSAAKLGPAEAAKKTRPFMGGGLKFAEFFNLGLCPITRLLSY